MIKLNFILNSYFYDKLRGNCMQVFREKWDKYNLIEIAVMSLYPADFHLNK